MAFSVPTSLRIGLWEAHGRRCTYCGDPLPYRDLEIDHIVPQHLGSTPEPLAELLATLGLPADFDLNDPRNLVPAHHYCNARKAGMVFQLQSARFYVELASRVAGRVIKEEQLHLRRARADRVLAALQLALETGDLTREQVAALAEPARSQDAFEVLKSVEFSSRIIAGLLGRTEAASLLDEPLLPRRHGLDELTMVRDSGDKRAVRTCREWAVARSAGFYPATTYDIKEEAFFKTAYSMIQGLSLASVADTSFVDVGQVGLDSLDLLPVTLLPTLSGDELEALAAQDAQGVSIGDLLRSGELQIEEATRNYLSLTYRYMGAAFWVILRADLNGDGIEDVLLSTYEWATQGTFGAGRAAVLTRRGADRRFEVVKGIELLPSGS